MTDLLKPLTNNIVFKFVDEIRDGMFYEVGQSGIILGKSHDNSAKESRWGIALAVGPDVTTVVAGQKILIEALRWTEKMRVDGESFWFTREPEVMCVTD